MRTKIELVFALLFSVAVGCGGGHGSSPGGGGGTDPGGGGGTTDPTMMGGGGGGSPTVGGPTVGLQMVSVSGQVVDFESGQPLASASVSATGVSPIPSVSMNGSDFMLTNVQPFSVFYIIASSPPDYRSTYNAAITVASGDVTGATEIAIKEATISSLVNAFQINLAPATAILMARALDANGMPLAGVPASAFSLSGATGFKGPFFLDDKKAPAPNLTATSASGWAIFFNVPPGSVQLAAAAGSITLTAPAAPMSGNLVTLVDVTVQQASMAPPPPTAVSFVNQVVPIFTRRGCVNCHSGDGPGRDEGGLALNTSPLKNWQALVQQISPNFNTTRVNLAVPEKSLVLTMPGYENPPDAHPTVVFATTSDPDYQLILSWIKAGALNN
jgi:hypothetical protein